MPESEIRHADHEPKCLAMLICDAVHFDPGIEKSYILGTFNSLRVATFPAALQLSVYFVLIDCLGTHNIRFAISTADEDTADDEETFSSEFELTSTDPLEEIVRVLIADVTVQHPGVFYLSLFSNSNPLCERRLIVIGTAQASE